MKHHRIKEDDLAWTIGLAVTFIALAISSFVVVGAGSLMVLMIALSVFFTCLAMVVAITIQRRKHLPR